MERDTSQFYRVNLEKFKNKKRPERLGSSLSSPSLKAAENLEKVLSFSLAIKQGMFLCPQMLARARWGTWKCVSRSDEMRRCPSCQVFDTLSEAAVQCAWQGPVPLWHQIV